METPYQLLFDCTPCATLVYAARTPRLLAANAAAQQLYGYTRDEFLALTLGDLRIGTEIAVSPVNGAIPDGGANATHIENHRRKDGLPIKVEVSALPVDFLGQAAMIVSVRAVAEPRENRTLDLLQTVMNNIEEHVNIIAPDGSVLWHNRATQGAIPEVAGKKCWELFEGRQSRCPHCVHPDILKDGQSRDYETILAGQGERNTIWLVHAVPLRNAAGEIYAFLETARDVTERRRAEQVLANEQRLLQALLTTVPDHIYFKDTASRFLRINETMAAFLGLRHSSEAVGKSDADFFDEVHAIEAYADEQRIMVSGELVVGKEEREVWPDGRVTWVSTTKAPLRDEGGRITGVMGISRDITETRNIGEQLRQSLKMQAIGQLAGGVAHDFNNILTAVFGYSELLLSRGDLRPDARHHIEEIHQAAARAATLTRQLLAFGRKQVLQPQVLDLNAVVSEMSEMLRRLIGENIDLVLKEGSGLGRVRADRGQIEQVLLNLAVNSRDAMRDHGTLTIGTANVTLDRHAVRQYPGLAAGDYVTVTVSDTGCGMSSEVKQHLFEPFFTTKGPGKGTGMGLATCYGIVKQSGGHIAVSSEDGNGTTFCLYLPLVETAAPVDARQAPQAQKLPRGTETILVVEDEPALRDLTRITLTGLGYRFLEAANGEEALAILLKPDCPAISMLITDVVMPRMGGHELVAKVLDFLPNLKVLFVSGYAPETAATHNALAHGAFLPKPFTPVALAGKIREVLGATPP